MLAKRWSFLSLRTALVLTLVAVLSATVAARAHDSRLLNKADLRNLVANAKTAQDHERLAEHFTAKAEQLEADAKWHQEYAAEYQGVSGKLRMSSYHCANVATNLKRAADAARQLAADHRELAR
jgi:hypothetical protein